MDLGKVFRKWVIDPITDNIKAVIGISGFAFLTAVCLILRSWLLTKHTLSISGWLWVIIFALTFLTPAIIINIVQTIDKRCSKVKWLTSKDDITIALMEWLRQKSLVCDGNTFAYAEIDKECKIPPGNSKALFSTFDWVCVSDDQTIAKFLVKGSKTIMITFTRGQKEN